MSTRSKKKTAGTIPPIETTPDVVTGIVAPAPVDGNDDAADPIAPVSSAEVAPPSGVVCTPTSDNNTALPEANIDQPLTNSLLSVVQPVAVGAPAGEDT